MINQKNSVVFLAFVVLLYAALLFGMLDFMFDDTPFAEFFRNLVLAFAAIFFSLLFGIPAGLKLNRRWQREQDHSKRRELLIALQRVFASNIDLLRQMYDQMVNGVYSIPSFSADTVSLEATSHIRYELLAEHLDLAGLIDKAQYELIHVNRRVELLQTRLHGGSNNQTNRERIEPFLQQLESFNETSSLAEAARAVAGLGERAADMLTMKLGTINLSVGLVAKSAPGTEPLTGGAIAHCNNAIAAIDGYLNQHPA